MNGIEEFTPEWFDACSAAWNLNKRRVGASYVYVCTEPLCERKVVSQKDKCVKHSVRETSRYTRHPLVIERMRVRKAVSQRNLVHMKQVQRQRQSTRLLQKRRLSHSIAERVIARRRL